MSTFRRLQAIKFVSVFNGGGVDTTKRGKVEIRWMKAAWNATRRIVS